MTLEKTYFSETLEGKRVILKRQAMEYAQDLNTAINDNKDFLQRFMIWAEKHGHVNDTKKYIAGQILAWEDQTCFDYAIWDKQSNEIIGGIGTVVLEWKHKNCEFGYWLTENAQGNGYMSEAVKLLEDEVFKTGFNRVGIGARVINDRSHAVPKRNGYTYEGTTRENVIENGETRSTVMHSKLHREWTAEQE